MADLIAAIATPLLPSAIGIVRLSGEGAGVALEKVFRPLSGKTMAEYAERQLVYGTMYDRSGAPIDHGLAFVSRAPASYTGEETAELQCHGAPMVLTLLLEALLSVGARQAAAGEFTKRAFLNGKLDLMQAEAVVDLIDAETPSAVRQAVSQLGGVLSEQIHSIYHGLVDVLAHFHAVLDYPDEDIDPFRAETIGQALSVALMELNRLLEHYSRGRQLVYGVPCAIVGRPNAGKSSLLNALLGYERAIVTAIPGTTRDTIEARVTLGGVLLRLTDTAGLRETTDVVEQLGVERSRAAAEEAELTFLVLDGTQPFTAEDEDAMRLAEAAPHCICLLNKADLPFAVSIEELKQRFPRLCVVSAVTGEGLDAVSRMVTELFPHSGAGQSPLLTNTRQFSAAVRAKESIQQAQSGLRDGMPPDLLLSDVEQALYALGELTGTTLREDITARIFSRFCVGK